LQTAGVAAGTAAAFAPQLSILAAGAKGANERLGVGFIGTGGRFEAHRQICQRLKEQGLVEPVAVCDVYAPRAEAAAEKTGGKIYRRHEELLADPRVDIVCIASPDRHHATQALDAIRAGKDVFCEKPLTHWSQFELAKQLGQEATRHQRIVQVGTQYMADDNYALIRQQIKQGIVGDIVHVQCGYFRRGDWGERMQIPPGGQDARPGPDLDWERFLGDAPQVPFSVSRFFQWRLYWDYAGGPATDLLVHTFTPIFALLDLDYPDRVLGGGGTFQYDREVPDQCNLIADYPDGPSIVMMNSLSNYTGVDTKLRGTDGIIIWKGLDQGGDKPGVRIVPHRREERLIPWNGMGDTAKLWANFVECVKTRKQPYSPIDVAVKVQAPLSMAILSHLENKVATFDQANQRILL
jgi:predicted dehydrogenase